MNFNDFVKSQLGISEDSVSPTIHRNDWVEYLQQVRTMDGYQLVSMLDLTPKGLKELEVYGVLTGGRNCMVEYDDLEGVHDFMNCPFHIRFTTEYGGHWHNNASEELKRVMTRKFMGETTKRDPSTELPRTAMDYLYLCAIDTDLQPDVHKMIGKAPYNGEKKGKGLPTFTVNLSALNGIRDESIKDLHLAKRRELAQYCFDLVGTSAFELHILGLVTDMSIEDKSKYDGLGVLINCPVSLIYVKPLTKSRDGISNRERTELNMKRLFDVGSGFDIKKEAKKVGLTPQELAKSFQCINLEANISSMLPEVKVINSESVINEVLVTPTIHQKEKEESSKPKEKPSSVTTVNKEKGKESPKEEEEVSKPSKNKTQLDRLAKKRELAERAKKANKETKEESTTTVVGTIAQETKDSASNETIPLDSDATIIPFDENEAETAISSNGVEADEEWF